MLKSMSNSSARDGLGHCAGGQLAALQASPERCLQQPPRIFQVAPALQLLAGEPDEGAARESSRSFGNRWEKPLRRPEMIILAGLNGLTPLGLRCQLKAVPQCIAQTLLENPQAGLEQQALPQTLHRRAVV